MSDYVSRLRAELLRAGAASAVPRRRAFLLPRRRRGRWSRPLAGAVGVVLLVAALVMLVPGSPHDEVAAQHSLTYRVVGGDAERVAEILRSRLSAAGLSGDVTARSDVVTITAPSADVSALTAPGRFAIYDWEESVLGPDGRPAPSDAAVTGGPAAGQAGALGEASARSRASRGGGLALQAGGGWFALADDPALTNADVAAAREDGTSVALDLTPGGREAFRSLTRSLAQRGADRALGGDPLQTSQHLALVLDGRIVSVPYINWREAPDGLDGASVSGFATPRDAQLAAAVLCFGPLPGTLELMSG
jgi:preprotein translocase subunit SecD